MKDVSLWAGNFNFNLCVPESQIKRQREREGGGQTVVVIVKEDL